MDSDLEAGLQQQLARMTASRRLTILGCTLISPARDPRHCPPGVLWLMTQHGTQVDSIKLFHPRASAEQP